MVVDQAAGRRRPLVNLQSGVYLKQVFFLNDSSTSFLCIGFFECLGNSLGFYIKSKSKKQGVLFNYDTFNRLRPDFPTISANLREGKKPNISLDSGEDIKVIGVFGRRMVALYDGFQTCTLDESEWRQFTSNRVLVNNCLAALYPHEESIRSFIFSFIKDACSCGVCGPDAPELVPTVQINQLARELEYHCN